MEQKYIKKYYLLQLASAVFGIILSVYLLVQHTRLMAGIQDGASFCSLGGLADCDVVNASAFSEVAGIPLAALGTLYFFLLLTIGIVSPPKEKSFRLAQGVLGWWMLFGLGFDAVLFVIQLVSLKTLCVICCLTYVANLSHLYFCLKLTPGGRLWKNRVPHLFVRDSTWVLPRWSSARVVMGAIAFVLSAVVVFLLPSFIRQGGANYTHVDTALEQFFIQWKERPVKKLEVKEHNGTWGNPNSKIQITEFSDFECPFCRKAAFSLHTVLKPYQDRVHFVFKHFPLDSTCNPALPYQIHAHACKLAKLAACAQKKNQFWEFHDQIFLKMTDEKMKEGFDAISAGLAKIFSQEEIKACLDTPSAQQAVAEDLHLGSSLNVRGTPTVYINGKHVTIPITIESMRKLIEIEETLVK